MLSMCSIYISEAHFDGVEHSAAIRATSFHLDYRNRVHICRIKLAPI